MHGFTFDTPTMVQFGSLKKNGPNGFKFLFERLGGFQVRFWKFGESADDKLEDPQDIEDGYTFIEKHAPRTKKGNAQHKCMRLQLCDPKSPIASWSRADIKDAMAGVAAEGNHASIETEWIITYRHLSSAGKRVVQLILRSLLMKNVLLLGNAGAGKTPFLWTLGMAMSRYHQIKAGITPVVGQLRTANDLELFKDEVGSKIQPWLLDDFGIEEHKPKELKSIFTVTAKENCVEVRYAFAKKVKGQIVLAADNPWDETKEPAAGTKKVSEKEFRAMIAPAFPNWGKADLDAVLKRTNCAVNGLHAIYLRRAGLVDEGDDVKVIVIPYGSESMRRMYITDQAKDMLERWTEHDEHPDPQQLEADIKAEQEFIQGVLTSVFYCAVRSSRLSLDAVLQYCPSASSFLTT